MNRIIELANSPIMWLFSALVVAAAIVQALALYRMANRYARQTGILTNEEIKSCWRAGGLASVGPAVSVFVLALSMISMLGAPFTLMRVGMIGAASTELTAASIGTEAVGVALGVDQLTEQAFTAALWCCAVMSSGYLIFVPMVTRGVGKALNKFVIPEEGKKQSWPAWFISALLPLIIFLALASMQATKSLAHLLSMAAAAILMPVFYITAKKLDKKWLKEWAMILSIIGGIIVGAIVERMF